MSESRLQQSPGLVDLNGSTIRAQLLGASLFPLIFFVLLSTLVTSSALDRMMLNLVIQRNNAQVQVLADALPQQLADGKLPTPVMLDAVLQTIDPVDQSYLYLIDAQGQLVASSAAEINSLPVSTEEFLPLDQNLKPVSKLMVSAVTLDELVVSFIVLPGNELGMIVTEPWIANKAPAFYYQLVLVGLLTLGMVLSLVMLSSSIGRVIRPIAVLAENATGALPGSIFHPVPAHGPLEIRALINAFNQMVIRLAEQQTALRQYAHKTLLSQEEERQRLSHELHDGTLQDLVGLTQRVELCRNELDRDPLLARRRLEELHKLLEQTIDDVRRISNALRPPVLEDFGLAIAVDALCKDLELEKSALQVDFLISGTARRLHPDLELAVYRVVQEALANIRKHAKDATLVQVALTFDKNEIRTVVKNNGLTFASNDIRSFVQTGHLGLAGMYERARLFEGKLEIISDADENTVVSLQLPYIRDSFQGD